MDALIRNLNDHYALVIQAAIYLLQFFALVGTLIVAWRGFRAAKRQLLGAKLDRVLDAHLDGVISREEYAGRKEKLLLERSALQARLAEVERQGNHWLEPLERFVRAAHQARSVASGENLESLKEWITRIGSNLRLAGRTVHVSYENPWRLVAARGRNDKWWPQRDSNPCFRIESPMS